MKYPARSLFIILIILFPILTIILALTTSWSKEKKLLSEQERTISPEQLLNEKSQRQLDDAKFSKKGFIVPLESNAKGSIYSARAQIRGTVVSWKQMSVSVQVADEVREVAMPGAVYVYCAPKYFTDSAGKQVLSSTVWMNIKEPEQLGKLLPSTNLPSAFPKRADITILVNVDEKDTFTAYFVGGYGCAVDK